MDTGKYTGFMRIRVSTNYATFLGIAMIRFVVYWRFWKFSVTWGPCLDYGKANL